MPKLELTLDIDLDADPFLVAQAWARAITQAVLRAIRDAQTVRYETTAARMAAFVSDLVIGQAWQRWYWKDFDGLKPLETSAALRTALLRDADTGQTAWRLLRPSNSARCLDALSDRDAIRLHAGFVLAPGANARVDTAQADIFAFAQTALQALRDAPVSALKSAAHYALWLNGTANSTSPVPNIAGRDALAIAGLALDPDADVLHLIAKAKQATSTDRSELAHLTDVQEQNLRTAMAQARAEQTPIPHAPVDPVFSHTTPFGGAFLLWPQILELPLVALCEDWPRPEPCDAAPTFAMAILARIFGSSMLPHFLGDAALDHIFPSDRPSVNDLECWINGLDGYIDVDTTVRVLDAWFLQEGVRSGNWRPLTGLGPQVLKADAQGYWIRLQDAREPHSLLQDAPITSDIEVDEKDYDSLCDAQTHPLVSQLAQICVKRLLWRIPGFANASVAHARQNLLAMDATVVQDGLLRNVRLGPVPLSIMLNLTGLSRQTYTLADGGRVRLSQGEGA